MKTKTIHETLEEYKSIKITAQPIYTEWKRTENRRERRAKERKNKKRGIRKS